MSEKSPGLQEPTPPLQQGNLRVIGMALQKIGEVLEPLDREAQLRVIKAVAILFDIELPR